MRITINELDYRKIFKVYLEDSYLAAWKIGTEALSDIISVHSWVLARPARKRGNGWRIPSSVTETRPEGRVQAG